jgi:hypothetical protein
MRKTILKIQHADISRSHEPIGKFTPTQVDEKFAAEFGGFAVSCFM